MMFGNSPFVECEQEGLAQPGYCCPAMPYSIAYRKLASLYETIRLRLRPSKANPAASTKRDAGSGTAMHDCWIQFT